MATLWKRKRRDGTKYETYNASGQYRGERIQGNTGCTSKAAARQWVEAEKTKIDERLALEANRKGPTGNMTLDEALAVYVDEKLKFSASFKTTEQYYIRRFIEMMDAMNLMLAEMSTADVSKYIRDRKQAGVANTSIIRELRILHAMHDWAADVWEHDCKRIAWKKIWPEAKPRVRHKPTVAEVMELIGVASPRLANLIKFATLTGLRKAELSRLEWTNLNRDMTKMVLIGKGNKEAELPISSAAMSILSSLPRTSSPHIFDTTNYRREWDSARRQTDLGHIEFHGLRHATATWMAEAGVPIETIQKAMRHASTDTTLLYIDAGEKRVSSALEKLASKMNQTGSTGQSKSQQRNKRDGS